MGRPFLGGISSTKHEFISVIWKGVGYKGVALKNAQGRIVEIRRIAHYEPKK